jgi:hypothetical protein
MNRARCFLWRSRIAFTPTTLREEQSGKRVLVPALPRLLAAGGPFSHLNLIQKRDKPLEIAQISTEPQSVADRRYLDLLFEVLETRPEVEGFEPGLSEAEIRAIERRFGLMFPPDLRGILRFRVPLGRGFPPWRGDLVELQRHFDWPFEGICFDVEHNGFWLAAWGSKPLNPNRRSDIVLEKLSTASRLIQIYMHRYIPSAPCQNGNPVYSLHQTDIIHYGNDLAGYFHQEFRVPLPDCAARTPRPIGFWDDALVWRD